MPPATTPTDLSPPSPNPALPYLEQLEAISSPVPDFAATLTTLAADDANDDNVSFLRTRLRSSPEPPQRRRSHRRSFLRPESEMNPAGAGRGASVAHMDLLDEDNSLSLNNFLNTIEDGAGRHIPPNITGEEPAHAPAYGSRIPQVQSMYDWAPGSDDEADEPGEGPPSYAQVRWHAIAQNRDRERESDRDRDRDREMEEMRNSVVENSTDLTDLGGLVGRRTGDSSLATAALLQSVRRHPRFSARTRTALQDYILDREERTSRQESAADRDSRSGSSQPRSDDVDESSDSGYRQLTHSDFEERIHAYARMHIQTSRETPSSSGRLQQALSYLEQARLCKSYDEVISAVDTHSLNHLSDDQDFILDTNTLSSPPPTSWLRPGTVFAGSQHAANSCTAFTSMMLHRVGNSSTNPHRRPSEQPLIVNGNSATSQPSSSRVSVTTSSGRRYWADSHEALPARKDEHWPVRVTIHSVDYDNMTLSGTMEAHNIPDKTQTANIVTYLEGEIIDFKRHTLETKSFDSDLEKDCEYWRMLAPFKGMSEYECVGKLLSRTWVEEVLMKGWILMRWKERCFITPTDSRQGLTISGFYFISLRREDGHIEGLYYDPGSSPYQQLSLSPSSNDCKLETDSQSGNSASAVSRRSSRRCTKGTRQPGVHTGGMGWPAYEFR